MKCPYCNKDMEDGYIYSFRRDVGVVWYPKGTFPGFATAKNLKKKGGVALSNYSFRPEGSKLATAICKNCNIGMFTIEKNASPDFFSDWFINDSY